MDVIPNRSRLRYVDAGDLDDATTDFDGLKVRNPTGEKLGEVDGAIVDVDSGHPYYVVVDSGGWFHSKLFLLPIGHVRLDHDNDALVAELTRDQVKGFPGFDRDEFQELSESELDEMDTEIASRCCPGEVVNSTATARDARWSHHRMPDWWNANYYRPDRAGARGVTAGAEYGRQEANRNATDRERDERTRREAEAEAVVAREGGEASPHLGGRAEPGDVIGVETGGERTYLGDTAKDEDDRRRSAEKAAGKQADNDLDRAKGH